SFCPVRCTGCSRGCSNRPTTGPPLAWSAQRRCPDAIARSRAAGRAARHKLRSGRDASAGRGCAQQRKSGRERGQHTLRCRHGHGGLPGNPLAAGPSPVRRLFRRRLLAGTVGFHGRAARGVAAAGHPAPGAAYEGDFREHQYGMSNQQLGGWFGDQLKALLLAIIFGTVAVVAIYAVIRRARQTWWLWGAMVLLALLVFQATLSPTYLEPVFNKFYPLPDSPLKQQILSLARANAIPAKQVYEFDASKQTTRVSAHVSGLFGSAQISLNDNLMHRASPEEIKAVLGHEMGHYVMNHIYQGIVYFGLIIVIGFAFLAWAQRGI